MRSHQSQVGAVVCFPGHCGTESLILLPSGLEAKMVMVTRDNRIIIREQIQARSRALSWREEKQTLMT